MPLLESHRLQFGGVVKRLGAQMGLAAPAMPRRRMHGPRGCAKFAGSGRCLGRRRGCARRRFGVKRDTVRKQLAAA